MRKVVFLTGGTGGMGRQTILKMLENPDEIEIRALVRDSKKNREKMNEYGDRVKVIWGDLTDFDLLTNAMEGVDYVFHVGALLNPYSTDFPADHVMKTNYGSTLAMLRGIKKFGQEEKTRFVYIGTVEMTGDRMPPIHWGRIGDPLKPSVYSYYANSKCYSERAVAESGLKYWASLRQSYMEPVNPNGGNYPIGGEIPYDIPAEHMDAESSGNLLRNIVLGVPDEFWGNAYNMGAGETGRATGAEWTRRLGMDPHDGYLPKWRALHNFHGQWYLDSDMLEEMVPHRLKTGDDMILDNQMMFAKLMEGVPVEYLPTPEQTLENNRKLLSKPGAIINIIEENDTDAIAVWFGSKAKYDAIPDSWDDFPVVEASTERTYLDHGYDETKPVSELDLEDMRVAAKFRGGECLSERMDKGELFVPLRWRCAFGHEFTARPNTVLKLGHWCPHCLNERWNYTEQAKRNPFFAQVWTPLHSEDEDTVDVAMEADSRCVDTLFE